MLNVAVIVLMMLFAFIMLEVFVCFCLFLDCVALVYD